MAEQNFFYSNLFIAIVTFIVGAFGLYLYHRQKRDAKRRAARIVLLEIKNAETQLKDAQDWLQANHTLPERLYTMPADSWVKTKHLFVRNLQPNEWNAINEFYNKCELFDDAIRHNDSRFAEDEREIRKNVHKASYKFAEEYCDKIINSTTEEDKKKAVDDFFKNREALVNILTTGKYIYVYTPSKQLEAVQNCLQSINMSISLSRVGTKLDKLSSNKMWIF